MYTTNKVLVAERSIDRIIYVNVYVCAIVAERSLSHLQLRCFDRNGLKIMNCIQSCSCTNLK